jgi:hypothetical protein
MFIVAQISDYRTQDCLRRSFTRGNGSLCVGRGTLNVEASAVHRMLEL